MSCAILYTFRRCPYAMRARIGLHLSSLNPELREIELRNKPADMLKVSPKGTIPVLVLADIQKYNPKVLDESLDIFKFSLNQYPSLKNEYLCNDDYANLLSSITDKAALELIDLNDNQFKSWLDKYKYADRHLDYPEVHYRNKACEFIDILEYKLALNRQLLSESPSMADYAIFPFVRQFAHVNKPWFQQSRYTNVKQWLHDHLESELFKAVMTKHPLWLDDLTQQHHLK
ncbi:glutathione S-transferase [Shewanella sp. 6_MG-2023]|uniref:glutathione S-transferase n=1 Tax=Shewanella sp. 6_MG-2023 TaxID=3062660 RepID=UPI0026E3920C|nr:glutathione S-transferase [Shewanella sp. 6_MG-2023]MDO6618174.1 glutathione S-transferase [Shewanella sp. 6_MG-2023]